MKTALANVWAYLKATYVRFNAESPRYWKTIQRALTWLAITTASISMQGQDIITQITGYGLDVPPVAKVIMGHIATAAFFARLIAGLAVDRDTMSEKRYESLNEPTVKPPTV